MAKQKKQVKPSAAEKQQKKPRAKASADAVADTSEAAGAAPAADAAVARGKAKRNTGEGKQPPAPGKAKARPEIDVSDAEVSFVNSPFAEELPAPKQAKNRRHADQITSAEIVNTEKSATSEPSESSEAKVKRGRAKQAAPAPASKKAKKASKQTNSRPEPSKKQGKSKPGAKATTEVATVEKETPSSGEELQAEAAKGEIEPSKGKASKLKSRTSKQSGGEDASLETSSATVVPKPRAKGKAVAELSTSIGETETVSPKQGKAKALVASVPAKGSKRGPKASSEVEAVDEGATADSGGDTQGESTENGALAALNPEVDPDAEWEEAEEGGDIASVLGETLTADEAAFEEDASLTEEQKHQLFLKGLIEALLFSSDKPMTMRELARAARLDKKRTTELLKEVTRDCRRRGMNVVEIAGGYGFRSNPAYSAYIQKLLSLRPVRLSRAQLETLAVIAYRQPVTRPEIDEVRGVDSGPVIKGLLDRDLIKMLGKKDEVGRPMLYGTTEAFLELFSLESLKELPNLKEFTELSDDSRERFRDELGEAPPGPVELSGEAMQGEALGDAEVPDAGAEAVKAEPGDAPEAEVALTSQHLEPSDSTSLDNGAETPDPTDGGNTSQPVTDADTKSVSEEEAEASDAEADDAEASDAEPSDVEASDAEPSDAEASDAEPSDAEADDAEATLGDDSETSDQDFVGEESDDGQRGVSNVGELSEEE